MPEDRLSVADAMPRLTSSEAAVVSLAAQLAAEIRRLLRRSTCARRSADRVLSLEHARARLRVLGLLRTRHALLVINGLGDVALQMARLTERYHAGNHYQIAGVQQMQPADHSAVARLVAPGPTSATASDWVRAGTAVDALAVGAELEENVLVQGMLAGDGDAFFAYLASFDDRLSRRDILIPDHPLEGDLND